MAGPLSGKLTGAEKNDASTWLPAKAESTKVLNFQSKFQSPNIFTGVVVYDGRRGPDRCRPSEGDRGRQGLRRCQRYVRGGVAGPFSAGDGQAVETSSRSNLGNNGWNHASDAADALRAIASPDANGMSAHITGPLGTAADSAKSFKGIDSTLLYCHPARRASCCC